MPLKNSIFDSEIRCMCIILGYHVALILIKNKGNYYPLLSISFYTRIYFTMQWTIIQIESGWDRLQSPKFEQQQQWQWWQQKQYIYFPTQCCVFLPILRKYKQAQTCLVICLLTNCLWEFKWRHCNSKAHVHIFCTRSQQFFS